MKDELARLEGMDERLRRAEVDYKDKLKAYRAEAALLTQARQALAARFESLMEAQLRDLGMQNTRFACVFESPEPGRKRVPTASGDDHVSFYIAPNPGNPSTRWTRPRPEASFHADAGNEGGRRGT